MLNESNAKDRDLEILRKRVMIETNELNSLNNKIELLAKRNNKNDKNDVRDNQKYLSNRMKNGKPN